MRAVISLLLSILMGITVASCGQSSSPPFPAGPASPESSMEGALVAESSSAPSGAPADTVAAAEADPARQQTLYLWEPGNVPAATDYTENRGQYFDDPDFRPYIVTFPVPEGTEVKGAVLICAGGAFQYRSDANEGTPVAQALEDIAVMGFSAGGILSGEMLLHWDGLVNGSALDPDYVPDALDSVSADAAACGMIYAFYGRLSVGTTDVEALRAGDLPPTFYCYGTGDPFYRQFLANADAAEAAGVPVERLQLENTPHGFGVQGGWISPYDAWLSQSFDSN